MASLNTPPHDLALERAVLSAAFMDRETAMECAEILQPEDFYAPANEIIFRALLELLSSSQPADVLTLSDTLAASGKLGAVGGQDYLLDVMQEAITTAHATGHARRIKEKSVRRQIIAAARDAARAAFDESIPIEDVVGLAESAILEASEHQQAQKLEPLRVYADRVVSMVQGVAQGEKPGLMTGFEKLDKALMGLKKKTVTILAGRPGMGKTALAMQIAQQCDEMVAFFSIEMPGEELAEREICAASRFDSAGLRTASVINNNLSAFRDAVLSLTKSKVWLDDSGTKTPMQVLSQCKRMKSKHGLGLIVIDYLQFMEFPGKHDSKEREVSKISRFLKRIAKELDVPVLALASLSRKCEEREDKRPMLSDLRESGSIESDAQVVMFVYRDEFYNKDAEKGLAEILIRKNKGGPTGKVPLGFDGPRTRFYNYSEVEKFLEGAGR